MWMVLFVFVEGTAIIKDQSIEIVIENICLYFHQTWKHASSDIEEFLRNVFVKTSDFHLCFRCGLMVSCCIAQCNHHTWIISNVHELSMGL